MFNRSQGHPDEVLGLAGHRTPAGGDPADDPRAEVVARPRLVRWAEERYQVLLAVFSCWREADRRRARGRARDAGSAETDP